MNPLGKEPSGKIASYPESIFYVIFHFIVGLREQTEFAGTLPFSETTGGPSPTLGALQCFSPSAACQKEEPALRRVYFLLNLFTCSLV